MAEKIAIVGAGAMGQLFALAFNECGFQPVMLETSPRVLEALADGIVAHRNGLLVRVAVHVSGDPDILRESPVVFIFVKSYSTGRAAAQIANSVSPESTIISLQNGLGNFEELCAYFPPERVVCGTTSMGAALIDGVLVPGGRGPTLLGGGEPGRALAAVEILTRAGFEASVTDNPQLAVWKKAVINSAINPVGAILRVPNGALVENPYTWALCAAAARESSLAAKGSGITLDPEAMVWAVESVCAATARNRCSMLQDIEAGRLTEIEGITGRIIASAERAGIDAGVNRALYALVKSLERVS